MKESFVHWPMQLNDTRPGMRGILKRVRVVCHPESEIALDTEQDSTPHTRTGDVTREARTGPTQDATRARSSDDTGDDVVVREDNADENRAEHPSSSGSDGRRRLTTKREPCEVRYAQTTVTEQHFPRKISGKTTLSEHPVARFTTQEGLDGYREKPMRVANAENNT